MRNYYVVVVPNPECFDGLQNVEFNFFFEFSETRFASSVNDINGWVIGKMLKEPIRYPLYKFVRGLYGRVINFKKVDVPVGDK